MKEFSKRKVYFVSDGTGITAESFGKTLTAQFNHVEFDNVTLPYIDTQEKAQYVVDDINKSARIDGVRPLLFSTIVEKSIIKIMSNANAFTIDIFQSFMPSMEDELQQNAMHKVGQKRSISTDNNQYTQRIDAVHYALDNDDGASVNHYDKADLIIIGVSRCGKTPTCLYMGLQFGIRAANYPLTEDDIDLTKIPTPLRDYKHKLFGLTINSVHLSAIRNERRPKTRYASLNQCRMEVNDVEFMFDKEKIPYINSTNYSVEEISTRIIAQTGIERRLK